MFDLGAALHGALAVYYFTGMWEWVRAIVQPLAREAFHKSMSRQRARYLEAQGLTAEQARQWEGNPELGLAVLDRYFAWAPTVDRFSPIRVEAALHGALAVYYFPGMWEWVRAIVHLAGHDHFRRA